MRPALTGDPAGRKGQGSGEGPSDETPRSRGGAFRLALPLYVGLLLVAAQVGVGNQALLRRQVSLLSEKEDLIAAVAHAQVVAGQVEGPGPVAEWAREHGMVPLPEGRVVAVVAPEPAPTFTTTQPVLELKTVWR